MTRLGEIEAVAHALDELTHATHLPFNVANYTLFDTVAIVAIKNRRISGLGFDRTFYAAMESFLPDEFHNNLTLNIYFLCLYSWEEDYGDPFFRCILEHCIDLGLIKHYECTVEGDTIHLALEEVGQIEYTVKLIEEWCTFPFGYLQHWIHGKEINITLH